MYMNVPYPIPTLSPRVLAPCGPSGPRPCPRAHSAIHVAAMAFHRWASSRESVHSPNLPPVIRKPVRKLVSRDVNVRPYVRYSHLPRSILLQPPPSAA